MKHQDVCRQCPRYVRRNDWEWFCGAMGSELDDLTIDLIIEQSGSAFNTFEGCGFQLEHGLVNDAGEHA